jgi:hypothetical protein
MVLLLHGASMRFTFAAARAGQNPAAASNALFSEFRAQRGTLISALPHRHIFLFRNGAEHATAGDDRRFAGDAGFETSAVAMSPASGAGPFASTALWARSGGSIGVECLSSRPWGLGVAPREGASSKALQAAVVNAYTQGMHRMGRTDLLTGVIFIAGDDEFDAVTEILNDLGGAVSRRTAVPLIAIQTGGHGAYAGVRTLGDGPSSVIAFLVPK